MAPPVYSVGQVVGASDVNNWFVPLVAYKTGDTSRASTTTRTTDPDLSIPVSANAVYDARLQLSYYTGSTAGIGFAFGFTGVTASGRWVAAYRIGGDTATASNGGPASTPSFTWTQYAGTGGTWGAAATPGDGIDHGVLIEGLLITGGTGGNLILTWAQDSSNSTALVLRAGSKLTAQRVG